MPPSRTAPVLGPPPEITRDPCPEPDDELDLDPFVLTGSATCTPPDITDGVAFCPVPIRGDFRGSPAPGLASPLLSPDARDPEDVPPEAAARCAYFFCVL